ncbi:hypothetical protein [Actinocorallia libanotica]|uniref:Uncharacterized protein n=1 Tax=Actinocorallia libanotica TaxID=46162 RepID=A0ABN1RT28_9ACTN
MNAAGLVKAMVGAFVVGVVFGGATAGANALSHRFADLESASYTVGGWSYAEVLAVVMDSGWAWAGLAVAAGWLVTRAENGAPGMLVRGAAAGALSLLVAVAAYAFGETIDSGGALSSFVGNEQFVWWVAGLLFGAPLGAVGACAHRAGVVGLLARLTVPVGAAVQMVLIPPGRNEVITAIGQGVVGVAAAVSIVFVVIRFLRSPRRSSEAAGAPAS